MASGHVNRIYRPNTRLHRPTLRREESPCQLGAVHTRGVPDMAMIAYGNRHGASDPIATSRHFRSAAPLGTLKSPETGAHMRRREFIAALGGIAAMPVVARAQGERVRRIGILLAVSPDDTEFRAWINVFLQTLVQSGWAVGHNISVETRWGKGSAAEIRKHVAELAALAPDVILAHGASTVGPLLQATRTVPVVFPIVGDPVGAGFVESLARPGGNRYRS
jgi:ABC transporter substrate binding protein